LEEIMKQRNWKTVLSGAASFVILCGAALAARAQDPAPEPTPKEQPSSARGSQQQPADDPASQDRIAPEPPKHRADGQRRPDLPIEAYAVTPGTKFLVRLEEDLNTLNTPEKMHFKVQTLEPLEAGSGIYLPAGAEITGHVSRVISAGVAGRAKLYLTFDEIHTRFGALPIVAELSDVPGDHSVRIRPEHEGVVEGRTSTQQAAGQAAAEGAAMGAVHGVKDKNAKEAGEGALAGAIAAYLTESGRGHELDLPKGAKLELELERALYLVKE
jgi:hypothetical protein